MLTRGNFEFIYPNLRQDVISCKGDPVDIPKLTRSPIRLGRLCFYYCNSLTVDAYFSHAAISPIFSKILMVRDYFRSVFDSRRVRSTDGAICCCVFTSPVRLARLSFSEILLKRCFRLFMSNVFVEHSFTSVLHWFKQVFYKQASAIFFQSVHNLQNFRCSDQKFRVLGSNLGLVALPLHVLTTELYSLEKWWFSFKCELNTSPVYASIRLEQVLRSPASPPCWFFWEEY